MKCMCAQTRAWFTLSSERVLGGMEFEPMLSPRENSPLPKNFPRGGSNPRRCGQQAQTLPTSYSGPFSFHLTALPMSVLRFLLLSCEHRNNLVVLSPVLVTPTSMHRYTSPGRIYQHRNACAHKHVHNLYKPIYIKKMQTYPYTFA